MLLVENLNINDNNIKEGKSKKVKLSLSTSWRRMRGVVILHHPLLFWCLVEVTGHLQAPAALFP